MEYAGSIPAFPAINLISEEQIMYENVFDSLRELLIEEELIEKDTLLQSNSKLKVIFSEMDSLEFLEFAMIVEDKYDINIENVHSILTYGNLVEVICTKLEEK